MKKLLIIIPAYNEEANIEKVVTSIIKEQDQYDYVVVNDGSEDRTEEICRRNGYELLNLPVNLGLSGAFRTGLKYAYQKGYQYAVQFDADGQHRIEFIPDMLEEIEKGYDIVIGSRFVHGKKGMSLRMVGSRMVTAAIKMTTGVIIKDPTSGMRMFSREIIGEFVHNLNYDPEPDTISHLVKKGVRVAEIPVIMDERQMGVSCFNMVGSVKYMIRILTSILLLQKFWIAFSGILIIMGIFPQLFYFVSGRLGFQEPINMIYLVILFILTVKLFLTSIQISGLESKVDSLIQQMVIDRKLDKEKNERKHLTNEKGAAVRRAPDEEER